MPTLSDWDNWIEQSKAKFAPYEVPIEEREQAITEGEVGQYPGDDPEKFLKSGRKDFAKLKSDRLALTDQVKKARAKEKELHPYPKLERAFSAITGSIPPFLSPDVPQEQQGMTPDTVAPPQSVPGIPPPSRQPIPQPKAAGSRFALDNGSIIDTKRQEPVTRDQFEMLANPRERDEIDRQMQSAAQIPALSTAAPSEPSRSSLPIPPVNQALESMLKKVNRRSAELDRDRKGLDAMQAQMDALEPKLQIRTGQQPVMTDEARAQHDAIRQTFNQKVDAFNQKRNEFNALVKKYNRAVGDHARKQVTPQIRPTINRFGSSFATPETATLAPPAPPKARTFGEAMVTATNNLLQFGAGTLPGSILKSISIASKDIDALLPEMAKDPRKVEDRFFYKAGQAVERLAKQAFPSDPESQKEFVVGILPQALASLGLFTVGGVVGMAAKAPGTVAGLLGAGAQGSSQYEEAGAFNANEDTKRKAFWLGTAVGASESLPVAGILNRFNKATGGTFFRVLKESGVTAAQEYIQEWSQQVGSNAIAQSLYDENRSIFDNAGISGAAGGASGAIVGALSGVLQGRKIRKMERMKEGASASPFAGEPTLRPTPVQQPVQQAPDPHTIVSQIPTELNIQQRAPFLIKTPVMPSQMDVAMQKVGLVPRPPQVEQAEPIQDPAPVEKDPYIQRFDALAERYRMPTQLEVAQRRTGEPIEEPIPWDAPAPHDVIPTQQELARQRMREAQEQERFDESHTLPRVGSEIPILPGPEPQKVKKKGKPSRIQVVSQPTPRAAPSVGDIHAVAEANGIPWDNSKPFMDLTEEKTGKRHLDDLTGPERAEMVQALEAQPSQQRPYVPGDPIDADMREALDAPIDEQAHEAATSPMNELPEPSEGQREAGNYKLGHTKIAGLDISIENPEGSIRSGTNKQGKPWQQELKSHYGYIRSFSHDGERVSPKGADKDHVDLFVKPGTPSTYQGPVYVVDQVDPDTGKFDEVKVLMGYTNKAAARQGYLENYEDGWNGLGNISLSHLGELKQWLASKKTRKSFSNQPSKQWIKPEVPPTPDMVVKNEPARGAPTPDAVFQNPQVERPRSELPIEKSMEMQLRAEKAQADMEIAGQERGGRAFIEQQGHGSTPETIGFKSATAAWYKELTTGPRPLKRAQIETAIQKIIKDHGVDVGVAVELVKEAILRDREFNRTPWGEDADAIARGEWPSWIEKPAAVPTPDRVMLPPMATDRGPGSLSNAQTPPEPGRVTEDPFGEIQVNPKTGEFYAYRGASEFSKGMEHGQYFTTDLSLAQKYANQARPYGDVQRLPLDINKLIDTRSVPLDATREDFSELYKKYGIDESYEFDIGKTHRVTYAENDDRLLGLAERNGFYGYIGHEAGKPNVLLTQSAYRKLFDRGSIESRDSVEGGAWDGEEIPLSPNPSSPQQGGPPSHATPDTVASPPVKPKEPSVKQSDKTLGTPDALPVVSAPTKKSRTTTKAPVPHEVALPQKEYEKTKVVSNSASVKQKEPQESYIWKVGELSAPDRESKRDTSQDHARPYGIPVAADKPISSFTDTAELKAHPDYTKAKSGDIQSATRLVRDLVKPETVEQAKQFRDAIFVTPFAKEASGENAIPQALAAHYARAADGQLEDRIIQVNRTFHTGADPMERIISRSSFEGPIMRGASYVLVDDVTTMGGTLSDLAAYIQRNGGKVAGIITLTNAMRSGRLTPQASHLKLIKERFGDVLQQEYGIDSNSLTREEANYLVGFRDANAFRKRASTANRTRQQRLSEKSVSRPEDRSVTPPSDTDTKELGALDRDTTTVPRGTEPSSSAKELADIFKQESEHAKNAVRPTQPRIPIDPIMGGASTPIGEMILNLEKGTGKKLTVGKTKPGTAGVYKPGSSATVIKYSGDLDTTAHEISHALDDQYGLVKEWKGQDTSPFDTELEPFSVHGSSDKNTSPTYNRAEGVAEYLRAWMVNPDAAEAAAPQFTAHVKAKLPADIQKALKSFSTQVRQWHGNTAHAKIMANVQWETPETGLTQWLAGSRTAKGPGFNLTFGDQMATTWTDRLAPFMKALQYAREQRGVNQEPLLPGNDPALLSRLFMGVNAKLDDIFAHGMVDSQLDRATPGGLSWLMEPLDQTSAKALEADMQEVASLMIAQRTIEKSEQLGKKRVSGIGAGIEDDMAVAEARLAELKKDEARYTKLKEAASRYRQWADANLRYLVDKGRLSQEQYEGIKANNEQYVAMQRILEVSPGEELAAFMPKGTPSRKLGAVGTPVQGFKGSTRTIKNPYLSLMDATHRSIREADRNEIMKLFRDLLTTDRGLYEGEPTNLASVGREAQTGEQQTIPIFVNGKKEIWQFHPDVYKALKGIEDGVYKLPGFLTILPKILRSTIVNTPAFALRNVIRDAWQRSIASLSGSKPWDTIKIYSKDEISQLKKSGGDQAGHYYTDSKNYARAMKFAMQEAVASHNSIVVNPAKLWTWAKQGGQGYLDLMQGSERQGRLSEYRRAFRKAQKKFGYDDYHAMLYAASQSRSLIDYAIAGNTMTIINQLIPFSNAAVQGIRSNMLRAKADPAGFALRFGIFALLPSLMNYAWNYLYDGDDLEEYRQLPAYQRDLFWNFKMGPDLWLKVPKPFELGVMASSFERTLDYANGNEKAFDGHVGALLRTILPVDDASLAGPYQSWLQAATNYDFFRDRPIVPRWEENLALDLRNYHRASRLGQALQQAVGVDARKIDFLLQSQFGYVGRYAVDLSDTGRKDRHGLTLSATGVTGGSPASVSLDAKEVAKIAEERGVVPSRSKAVDRVTNMAQITSRSAKHPDSLRYAVFRKHLNEYYKSESREDRDRIAKQVRADAKYLRELWEKSPPRPEADDKIKKKRALESEYDPFLDLMGFPQPLSKHPATMLHEMVP